MGAQVEQAGAEALPESEVSVDAVEGFEVKEPTVCSIMLTRDRPEMAKRAVECWMEQTYENKRLLIIASGESNVYCPAFLLYPNCNIYMQPSLNGWTIGAIRNYANAKTGADILLHWDDDDWSNPNRIAEQVSLLQSSGADAVGYREMLFWDSRNCRHEVEVKIASREDRENIPGLYGHAVKASEVVGGEAWLYTNNDPRYIVGSSLCYWRAAWERQPFNDIMRGEDYEFVKGLKSVGVSANHSVGFHVPMRDVTMGGLFSPADVVRRFSPMEPEFRSGDSIEPRMICSIHGGNTCGYTEATLTGSINWRRVPEWDGKLREVMSL